MRAQFPMTGLGLILLVILGGCWGGESGSTKVVVNSLQDAIDPVPGTVTLRNALEMVGPGGTITFDESLNGGTVDLDIIGNEHAALKGEVFTLVFDPMPPHWQFDGYLERDYGATALYSSGDLTIDASELPDGITLSWAGGENRPARVLAVHGDLTMKNVNISSGVASAVFLTSTFGRQNYSLARGGGLAVWGVARLTDCTVSGNEARGENEGSRDRGAFGGGIYADALILDDCIVSGNSVRGYGAAGGGVFSVGGRDSEQRSSLTRCSISGNRIAGLHTYGGGVYTDGGGRGRSEPITLTSCTIARNLVMHIQDIPVPDASTERYYRGGGVYMSNGYLRVAGCTIAENAVTGYAATFHSEPNMSGGGIAATVGDAHVVEDMQVGQSIIVGNTVEGMASDLFTGSLVDFYSWGHNFIGKVDFDYIHVPVPWWFTPGYMSRKHYPKAGDRDGVDAGDVLSLLDVQLHPTIVSAGVARGDSTVLWYPPAGAALDTVPADGYTVPFVRAGFYGTSPFGEGPGFLNKVLEEIKLRYGMDYSAAFNTTDLSAITFYGPSDSWPDPEDHPENQPWIMFWRQLDAAIAASPGTMGVEKLADDFWGEPFDGNDGPQMHDHSSVILPVDMDQLGRSRRAAAKGDAGAIEVP